MFLAGLVLSTLFLPTPQRVKARVARDPGAIAQFFGTGFLAIAAAAVTLLLVDHVLGASGVLLPFTLLLLLPLVTLETFIALNRPLYYRQLRRRPLPPLSEYHPPVSILMPAYNEERWIAEAIRHADLAASGNYPGTVEIIVGNDGSTDRTSELAAAAIRELRNARGLVVDLPHAGKSNGLNGALALASGEIVDPARRRHVRLRPARLRRHHPALRGPRGRRGAGVDPPPSAGRVDPEAPGARDRLGPLLPATGDAWASGRGR